MVTRNRDDFFALTTEFFESQRPHAGVLVVPRSLPNRDATGIARALHYRALQQESDFPSYTADYLSAAPID